MVHSGIIDWDLCFVILAAGDLCLAGFGLKAGLIWSSLCELFYFRIRSNPGERNPHIGSVVLGLSVARVTEDCERVN